MDLDRAYERDVDLLLAEEFEVNEAFADAVIGHTRFAGRRLRVIETSVSLATPAGESDLVVVLADSAGERVGLLIEDKIDAVFQPDQAKRYALRARDHQKEERFGEWQVLLLAPQAYLGRLRPEDGFPHTIAYESLAKILRKQGDRRAIWRAEFLEKAADRRATAWRPTPDAATDAFWDAVWSLASSRYPRLEMSRPRFSKDNDWLELRPGTFKGRPRRPYIQVKGAQGAVDLTFERSDPAWLAQAVAGLLDSDMKVTAAGKSAVVRLEMRPFRVAEGFEQAEAAVTDALGAAERLLLL